MTHPSVSTERPKRVFQKLQQINHRPRPFEFYTAADLWTDEHTSKQMLAYHLNADIDVSSRNAAFIATTIATWCPRMSPKALSTASSGGM